ncbi:hypothetical protein [Microbaculum marinisediminis]|uniref:Uncharacterized protein n=1 Tax=Microbaculum marinisediminis TaxID=2931392 RepID=A0AAW5R4G6_9HYPH|nr:hypothetical protein [Microbaculum sp. A6E488]MCT8974679.1 hypothetical protein [Microbaculum sp. A6E488]
MVETDSPLQNLIDGLECAVYAFAEDKRAGHIEAVYRVSCYLLDIGIETRLLAPLNDLLGGFEKRDGNQSTMDKAQGDALIVAAVKLLIEAGCKAKEARKKVALAHGGLSEAQVGNLYKNITSKRKSSGARKTADVLHQEFLSKTKNMVPSPDRRARVALEMVQERFSPNIKV